MVGLWFLVFGWFGAAWLGLFCFCFFSSQRLLALSEEMGMNCLMRPAPESLAQGGAETTLGLARPELWEFPVATMEFPSASNQSTTRLAESKTSSQGEAQPS